MHLFYLQRIQVNLNPKLSIKITAHTLQIVAFIEKKHQVIGINLIRICAYFQLQ